MERLDEIADRIHQSFEAHTSVRDQALSQTRTLTRHCAQAIRAKEADYVLALKENQGTLYRDVVELFADARQVDFESPVDGQVVAVNDHFLQTNENVLGAPRDQQWICRIGRLHFP